MEKTESHALVIDNDLADVWRRTYAVAERPGDSWRELLLQDLHFILNHGEHIRIILKKRSLIISFGLIQSK